jgi:hypothetical protein
MCARALLFAVVAWPGAMAAQLPRYDVARLHGAVFAEQVHSDIATQAGTAERHRTVNRTVQYTLATRADTVVATSDSVSLSENADGVRTEVDVDAVTGARWTFLLDAHGASTLLDGPVVPRSVADVSDIGTAMDDFFPPSPPRVGVDAFPKDSAGWQWHRLADSAGVERYHYAGTRHDSHQISSSDSVRVESTSVASETADFAWDPQRGPLAWSRQILTTVSTHFAGRTVRAKVEQQIMVRRIR